jgi:2-polyprenyl-6-methoxyphenol hydroxylase-like FAD-dependent oxidoreductase
MDADVLVVGAGPVGLVLATELERAGVRPLVIERLAEPNPERKARGIGPLAAEALRRRGLGDQLAEHHQRGAEDFKNDHGSGNGHFAWIHKIDLTRTDQAERTGSFIWQPQLERLLRRYAAGLGVSVLGEHTLTGLVQDHDRVTATVDTPGGERRITAGYLVGCDGDRSTVRKLTGFEFPGTEPFMVMRAARVVLAAGTRLPAAGRLHGGSLMHGGEMLGTVEFGTVGEDNRAPLTADELAASVRRVSGATVTITAMREGRRVLDHARQAATYRLGRVLLAGDAAHVHSPNGGQGLNLGLMDAVNLGWKLASAVSSPAGLEERRAPNGLLDSYTAERHPVGAAVLHNTRAQSALLRPGPHADALRDIMSDLMDLPEVNAYFAELMTGLRGRYPMPYEAGAHPLLGRHSANLSVTVRTPSAERRTSLYTLAETARPLFLHPPEEAELAATAAPWSDRVTPVPAVLGTPDHGTTERGTQLSAALIRPDGVLAWAEGTGRGSRCANEPSRTEGLRVALAHWFGRP